MNNIIIVGSSGQARTIMDAVEKVNKYWDSYHIIGLIDDFRHVGEKTWDYQVLGRIEDLPRLMKRYSATSIVIAIGDNFSRWNIYEKIKQLCPAAIFPSIVHPGTFIARGVSIGEGTYVGAGSVVNNSAKIGKVCLVNAIASVGHDTVMEDFSSIASQSVLGAYGRIGFASVISMGVTILQRTNIGEHTIVGAGATVTKDLPPYVVAYGIPAKVIRDRKPGDKYLDK
jgi:sugar O-acyltransferase (sialic acid O-acetyltransferase NeuD family)